MKKIILLPALALFAATPALAQTTPSGTVNSDMGRTESQLEGAKESHKDSGMMGRSATQEPMAPSQIEKSESQKPGATPTDENKDEIRQPVK
ncbi:hypothetical protein [Terrihabitans sp. B22-R8]|uniref:hypothetical protein n=1 Tax=Terrihabitans sp. B22-R8 TaxID=3425128 RepID=UPI00403D4472